MNYKAAMTKMLFLVACLLMLWCTPPPRKAVEVIDTRTGLHFPPLPPNEALLADLKAQMAADPENPELWKETGTIYQVLSQPAKWAYMDEAVTLLEKAQPVFPEDAQVLAYLGLAIASRAQNPEVGLLDKFSAARQGFRLIDQAVTIDGENFALRLLRAKMGVKTPAILGRGALLDQDLQWIERYIQSGTAPDQDLVLGYALLGDYQLFKKGDKESAHKYWLEAAEIDSPYNFIAVMRLNGEDPPY